MSLKGYRQILETDMDHFMNSTATRGGIVSISGTSASGIASDQAEAQVSYSATLSGVKPLGMLLQDVVNYDLTRQRQNPWRDEVQLGNKVAVAPKCVVVTDFVYPGHSPVPGAPAYIGHSGYIAASNVATDHSDTSGTFKVVGQWVTGKNEDGFAKVRINLPR